MMKFFQKLGKSLMLPVACLPVCGILMGIGYILAPAAMAGEVQGFTAGGLSYSIGLFLIKAGGALIDNMSWLFAVGVAVGMAQDNDGTAGLAGLVSMYMITTLLSSGAVAGITGKEAAPAFGKIVNQFVGILSGLIGSYCYNKYRTVKLPDALAFFSGKRAVAIFTALYSIVAALILFFIWPLVYGGLVSMGEAFIGMGAIGAGIPPYEIKQIVTVCKAYSSAVGAGAFVSEIFGDEADELRRRGGDGGEFGATTGRPRRMGWFDCVASKYGCRLQGTTDVAFTVLDVLGYLDEIPVCVGYEIDGEVTTDFPTTAKLEKAKPVLKKLPGWKCDIRGIRKYEDLPENCRKYVEFVEKHIGFPITMISNGPGRSDIIYR